MNARFDDKLLRRLSRVYLITAALYLVFGLLLAYQAWAQTQVQNTIMMAPFESVPTGSDDRTVRAF